MPKTETGKDSRASLPIFFMLLFLAGCATTSNIGKIEPGWTQTQVRESCGEPISVEFDENTTGWLYKNLNDIKLITGPEIRYYWVIFDQENRVIAVRDAGPVPLKSGSGGMNFLCKDAIARGDDLGVRTHCK
jgi:hypothetical protein